MSDKDKASERLIKQVCPDGFIDCRAHPASSLRAVEYIRADLFATVRREAREEAFREAGLIVRQLSIRSEKYPNRYTSAAGFKTRVESALERAAESGEGGG